MPVYLEIVFTKAAERDFEQLPRETRERVDRRLFSLAQEPLPAGAEKLDENTFRVRVGAYRIIYGFENNNLVILVIRIRHRKEVYRRLLGRR